MSALEQMNARRLTQYIGETLGKVMQDTVGENVDTWLKQQTEELALSLLKHCHVKDPTAKAWAPNKVAERLGYYMTRKHHRRPIYVVDMEGELSEPATTMRHTYGSSRSRRVANVLKKRAKASLRSSMFLEVEFKPVANVKAIRMTAGQVSAI